MSLSAEGIGNLIASIIAFAAIVGLIYQSRSTRKQIKLQNFIEYTKRYQEIILHFPEEINESNFKIAGQEKSIKDNTLRYMRAYFDLCFEEYILFKKGFIDDDLWSIWHSGMTVAFSKAAFQEAWTIIRQNSDFGGEFESFVEQKMTTKTIFT